MGRYRAVLLVPSVVEFDNPGTDEHVTGQIVRIASGMGKCLSLHPKQGKVTYAAKVVECVKVPDKE